MKYYTLIIKENGIFRPEFGDFEKEVVEDEKQDMIDSGIKGQKRIICTGSSQAEIDAKINQLNGKV